MPKYPHVDIDLRHRTLTIYLSDAAIVGTRELDDAHLVDVDAGGRPVSIEILTPDDWKLEELGKRFGFSDQVQSIRAALNGLLYPPTGTAVSYGKPIVVEGESKVTTPPESEGHTEKPTWQIVSGMP